MSTRSIFWRYSIAVVTTAAAIGASVALPGLLAPMRLFFFWCAVLATAVFGGVGPAALATVLSLAGAFALLEVSTPTDVLRLALFALFAGGISLAVGFRRRAEERAAGLSAQLQANETRYRALAENSVLPQAVWTAGTDGKIQWSDQWLAITGQAREQIERSGGMNLVHPEDARRTSGRWRAATLNATLFEDELRVCVADGTYRWFAIKGVPVRDRKSKKVVEWVGTITDIHDRKRHEEQTAFINRASELLTSSLDHEQTLRNLERLCVPDLGDHCRIDLDVVVAEETQFSERQIIAPMIARGRVIGALTVTSERRYTEEDVPLIEDLARRAATAVDNAKLYEAAEAANRAKDEFLATLSHELRTPLTAISGWAYMLQQGIADEETASLAIDTILRSASVQRELIDDLLDLSRVVAGTLHLNVATQNLTALVHEVIVAAKPAADAKGLTLELLADGVPVIVRGDERRLRQVVWNLVSNAVKFTDSGGSIRVHLSASEGNALVEVVDTGRGVDPSFLPHVWDRFRQADSSTSRQYGGLGLGLAVVRHLVEMHGGTVSAKSEVGRGSTFSFSIPLARPEYQSSVRAEVPSEAPLRGKRVLLVDDDPDARIVIGAMLRHAGGEIVSADSVENAIGALAAGSFDIVVTDIAMPGEDGYSLLRRVRERSGVPVVAVSAIATGGDDREHALKAGFAEFIRKPVDPLRIANVVAGALPVSG